MALDASEQNSFVVKGVPKPLLPFWEESGGDGPERSGGQEMKSGEGEGEATMELATGGIEVLVEKSSVWAVYPLRWVQRVNGNPIEVLDSMRSWTGMQDEDPISQHRGTKCQVQRDSRTNKHVVETAGFACHCTFMQSIGFTAKYGRNHLDCNAWRLLFNLPTVSIHCMRFSPDAWWDVFELAPPVLEWYVDVKVKGLRGEEWITTRITSRNPNRQFTSAVHGFDGFMRIVGDFAMNKKINSHGDVYLIRKPRSLRDAVAQPATKPTALDRARRLDQHDVLPLAGVPAEQFAVDDEQEHEHEVEEEEASKSRRLGAVSDEEWSGALEDAMVEKGSEKEGYLLPRSMFDFGASAACNKIGVSMKSFVNQGSRCEQEVKNCLHRQITPELLSPGNSWKSAMCPGDGDAVFRVQHDSTPMCRLTESHVTELVFTLEVEDLALVVGDPPVRISEVLVTRKGDTVEVAVKVMNMDANFAGNYRVWIDSCGPEVGMYGSGQVVAVAANGEEAVYFQMRVPEIFGETQRRYCMAKVQGISELREIVQYKFPIDIIGEAEYNKLLNNHTGIDNEQRRRRECARIHFLDLVSLATKSCTNNLLFLSLRLLLAVAVILTFKNAAPYALKWAVKRKTQPTAGCELCGKPRRIDEQCPMLRLLTNSL
jgi:hypothetical protein